MSVTSADEPYSTIVSPVGETYHQEFSLLGRDGQATTFLPPGWAFSDDGRIFGTSITEAFPVGNSLGQGTTVFNAGHPDDLDRAVAVGVTSSTGEGMLQLVADVIGEDAKSLQLQFDIEAWDAKDGVFVPALNRIVGGPDEPGEAAFNVTVEINSGDGFTPLVDFGTVTTGPTLQPVFEGIVDGNADANRVSFDTGLINVDVPEGSRLRVRWMADTTAKTRDWVYGLDNVSLGMFATITDVLGDFNGDGMWTTVDIDALTAEISSETDNSAFDLTGDGLVNDADLIKWRSDGATHNGFSEPYFLGDSDLDGSVDSTDLNNLALNWQQGAAEWSGGDFTADGFVDSADLNALALNWRQSAPMASALSAPVPEPSALLLSPCRTCFGLATAESGLTCVKRKKADATLFVGTEAPSSIASGLGYRLLSQVARPQNPDCRSLLRFGGALYREIDRCRNGLRGFPSERLQPLGRLRVSPRNHHGFWSPESTHCVSHARNDVHLSRRTDLHPRGEIPCGRRWPMAQRAACQPCRRPGKDSSMLLGDIGRPIKAKLLHSGFFPCTLCVQ